MDISFLPAAAAIFTLIVGGLALLFTRSPSRPAVVRTRPEEIPRGLKTAAKLVKRFYAANGIQVKAIRGNVGFQTRTLVFAVPSRMQTKKMSGTRQDLEHYLLNHGIRLTRGSLEIDIGGEMAITWGVKSGSMVKLSAIYRQYYRNGKRPLGGVFPVGTDMDGRPFCLHLNRAESPHAIIVGSTGAGKTIFAMCVIVGAIHSNWDVLILNPKTRPKDGKPGLWDFTTGHNVTYVNRYDDMVVAVNRLVGAINNNSIERPTLIVADEMADIFANAKEAAGQLGFIAGKGREYDVHILGIAPKTTKSVLVDDMLHANIGTTLVGMKTNSKYLAMYGAGMGGLGLENLAGSGHAKVRQGSEIVEIQGALPDNIATTLGDKSNIFSVPTGIMPITDLWMESVPVGGAVSKDGLRRYASENGAGIGYPAVREQYDRLVQLGRIQANGKFQAGEKVQ